MDKKKDIQNGNTVEISSEVSNKTSGKPLFIIGTVLCIIFAFLLICNLTIIVKGTVNPDVPPSVLGVTPMVVQSGSMSGTAEGHLEVGDLIFIVKPDADKLKVGDVISFMDGGIVVTHRIIEVTTGEDGEKMFVTKGDANNAADPAISASAVVGVYKSRIPKLGDFAMFLQQPLGMLVFIGIPVCVFIIYDIIRRQKNANSDSGSDTQ